MPVVPCGRRVVISGILAGGTPDFRNVVRSFLHPSQAPCFCGFAVFGVASMYARLNRQHISKSHRLVLCFSLRVVGIAHRQFLDCVGVHALF